MNPFPAIDVFNQIWTKSLTKIPICSQCFFYPTYPLISVAQNKVSFLFVIIYTTTYNSGHKSFVKIMKKADASWQNAGGERVL